jgi:hypothetical protein
MDLNSDFKELLSILNGSRAKDLIVGGYAVIEYTEPRKDLDIWIDSDRENAEVVYAALKEFGAPLLNITVDDFTNPDIVYHMGKPPSRIDILMGLKGLNFEESWKKRNETEYSEIPVNIISPEDLLVNKRLAGRAQDLIDAENLELAAKRSK